MFDLFILFLIYNPCSWKYFSGLCGQIIVVILPVCLPPGEEGEAGLE